ncbi:hypothetical protein [Streptomyces sp. NPDC003667]
MLNFLKQHASVIVITLLGATFAAIGFYTQFAAGDKPSSHRDYMMWAGTLSQVGVVVLGAIQVVRVERKSSRIQALSVDYQTRLNETLDIALKPLTQALADMSEEPTVAGKRYHLGNVQGTALTVAASLMTRQNVPITTKGARASLYLLDSTGAYLDLKGTRGRSVGPRTRFDLSTPEGLYMKKTLDDGMPLLIDGATVTKRFPASDPLKDYAAVIVVRVQADGTSGRTTGVLCVDAPEAGDLNETHRAFTQVLANVLGVAYAQA